VDSFLHCWFDNKKFCLIVLAEYVAFRVFHQKNGSLLKMFADIIEIDGVFRAF
jgi:hypothetical protein